VTTVEVTGVNEDTMKLIDVAAVPLGVLVKVLAEVKFEGEFVSVIDLEVKVKSASRCGCAIPGERRVTP
jgi:hypothetical protein